MRDCWHLLPFLRKTTIEGRVLPRLVSRSSTNNKHIYQTSPLPREKCVGGRASVINRTCLLIRRGYLLSVIGLDRMLHRKRRAFTSQPTAFCSLPFLPYLSIASISLSFSFVKLKLFSSFCPTYVLCTKGVIEFADNILTYYE